MSSSDQPKCPVDVETREAWLAKARQSQDAKDKVHEQINQQQMLRKLETGIHSKSTWKNSISTPASTTETPCPVDHTSRELWTGKTGGDSSVVSPRKTTTTAPEAIEVAECSSDTIEFARSQMKEPVFSSNVDLPEDREISSIPRTGSGSNWIYPSQKQFFNAMLRKSWNPESEDMQTIVPLHNLVNERAWGYIQMWENNQGGEKCGGIQLTSFKGDSKKITPRAWLGHYVFGRDLPFDRHDWVVDRCGVSVEYVIDFYSKIPGENEVKSNGDGRPTFYLDVRPKLNSYEGCKLRIKKAFGI
ncbi:hypothetical protein CANARDRAFT_194920 [[Candida] arabinofermentans NRRL YB-2248]|uniref:Holocytochrome c-type synthase n=1 Tax=[Candida] arabinofermentans NRRL YB-2248 TaxID=983967 RepID=A0A1E4T5Z6_9ASCO|nr:hypothetical protein CANARDRAFT_194920 [[Candida] arabinofermentans NRRL YB-2248]